MFLLDQIKASEYYSASFDENLNKIIEKEQMDIYITYGNSEEKGVEIRYSETDFMGYTKAKDLQHSFNEKLKSLTISKLLQIGMGSPNLNCSFYDKLCDERSKLTLKICFPQEALVCIF